MHSFHQSSLLSFLPWTGSVPTDMCSPDGLSSLADVILKNNVLNGTLDVANCTSIIMLDASFNNFSGIPELPQYPSNLRIITVDNNTAKLDLGAAINKIVDGSQYVTDISFANNLYDLIFGEGGLFWAYFKGQQRLLVGNLMDGHGTFQLPTFFCMLHAVESSIPTSITRLWNLRSFNFFDTGLAGSLPPELFEIDSLSIVKLAGNGLTGSLPATMGKAASLSYFDVSYNSLVSCSTSM